MPVYARAMRQEGSDQAGSPARGKLARDRIELQRSVEYLLRGNLVNLVLTVVIGVAFWSLVQALAVTIITPIAGEIVAGRDMTSLHFTFHDSLIDYGFFLSALITFVVIVAVALLVLRPVARMAERQTHEDLSHTKACPECLSGIPRAARRCSYCTSLLTHRDK